MKLTKEQFEVLKPYEKQLHTAYYGGFVRNVSSLLVGKVEEISREVTGNPRFRIKKGCPACILDAIVKIAPYYFEVKEVYTRVEEVSEVDKDEVLELVEEDVKETTKEEVGVKRSTGRPKGSKNKPKEGK